jgi:hypothetical protein
MRVRNQDSTWEGIYFTSRFYTFPNSISLCKPEKIAAFEHWDAALRKLGIITVSTAIYN